MPEPTTPSPLLGFDPETLSRPKTATREVGRDAPLFFGGWEVGLLVIMALLYAGGLYLNPAFFGSAEALFSILRDASRYGVMAVGMTFVIVNKELDLSVGSTFGLTATIFGVAFAPTYFNSGLWTAIFSCLAIGLAIGLLNGFMVTVLEVPAFIATLTMLFIGRGVILGLTGGKNIAFEIKAQSTSGFFGLGDINALGFNNQIILFLVIAAVGAVALARTTIGWTTYATGGNEQAARYAGINTRLVRMRSYVLSSLCAVTAGLMSVAQNKDADPLAGFGVELIVISSVIVGGTADLRRPWPDLRLLPWSHPDRAHRQGSAGRRADHPDDRSRRRRDGASGGGGATAAGRGSGIPRRRPRPRRADRTVARSSPLGRPPVGSASGPPAAARPRYRRRGAHGVQTRGTASQSRSVGKRGLAAFFHRRDAAAVLMMVALWLFGLWARPDFWAGLDNSFAILLAFSEIALLSIGLTFVMANGDIDLSVGSVLALSGAVAAVIMKDTSWGPFAAVVGGHPLRRLRRDRQRLAHRLSRASRLHCDSRHLLLGERRRVVDRRRHPAQRISRILRSHRPRPLRAAQCLRIRAHYGPVARHRRSGERPDDLRRRRGARRGHRARLYDLRPEGLCDRRQRAGGELRGRQHTPRAFYRARHVLDLRGLRRNHLRRLLPELHSDRRPVARARRHLVRHHRRRLDLRRLRHDDRLAGGRRGHYAHPLAPLAPDHPERRRARSCCRSIGRTSSSA